MELKPCIDTVKRLKGTYDMDSEAFYHALDEVIKAVEEINTRNQWIPVSNPPEDKDKDRFGRLLVAIKVGSKRTDIITSVFSEGNFEQVINGEPTHWQPLPSPPGSES